MRIALLAPLPPEQTGIADYAAAFKTALQAQGIEVTTPLPALEHEPKTVRRRVDTADWRSIDLVHAELGGGRLGEFHALSELRRCFPSLPLTATVHDPERLVWRRHHLPWPFRLAESLPKPFPQIATVLCDPLTLREEQALAQSLDHLVTLTRTGAECLKTRMRLNAPGQITVIHHGNREIPPQPLPALDTIRLLYFGFIYRGKGIEDLLDALNLSFRRNPALHGKMRLTLAGGSAPEIAFGACGNYLGELRARIESLNLTDAIDWRLNLPEATIPELIQAHHAVLLPYRESKKLSLLGAMRGTSGVLSWASACGRGVICSDARAFAEEVSNGNGIVYPQGNIEALSIRMLELAENTNIIYRWAQRAYETGCERAWPNTAMKFRKLFENACQGA